MTKCIIDDGYLDEFKCGGNPGDDVLLLVIASVTPSIDSGEELPTDKKGNAIYASPEEYLLTDAGLQYAGMQIAEITHALGRPFNDDDCSYGDEYGSSDDIETETPLRFIYPKEKMRCPFVANVKWTRWGTEQFEEGENQDGVIFFDWGAGEYKTAFIVSLVRGNDPSSYLLYWDHVEPYLSPLACVSIGAYNDDMSCVTHQDYSYGQIDDEHYASNNWLDNLALTSKEISAIRQRSLAKEDGDYVDPEVASRQGLQLESRPMLRGKALIDLINSGQYTDKSELVKACGYVTSYEDGSEKVHYTAFLEAKNEAESSYS